ncbi:hypothetical protein AJ78_03649 [Emergomyces pasteurianus Ep9510]|uniref:Uncharacterized protein n=1 Tax=Emergomyces pasteurianus Ep9510 TaxID=1447872 RepID=A0A1J9PI67_9EURO|nr:hypothetical protein AJ78_03649 [Emergomyces pasteurianus Ep9510]
MPKLAVYSAVPRFAQTEMCVAMRAAVSVLNLVVFASNNTVNPSRWHVVPMSVPQDRYAAMRAAASVLLLARGARNSSARRNLSNVDQIPAHLAKFAVMRAAVYALLLVEDVRNNNATQFAPARNVARRYALLIKNAATPAVESALLLVGFVLSSFADLLRLDWKMETTLIDHILECYLYRYELNLSGYGCGRTAWYISSFH